MDVPRLATIGNVPYAGLLILIIGLLTILHSWRLIEIPQGLYVDETSIGLNAALIAETGVDEHGERLPIFFKAFGEYKNPVYIYTAAALFSLFGPSVWLLRFTSVLYFTLFLVVFTLLIHRLFGNRIITLFLLLSAGTLPWFFPLSRISFEVVAQLVFSAGGLLLLHYAFKSPGCSHTFTTWAAGLAGLLWGMSTYTYSTARLLAFAFVGTVLLLYARRRAWRQSLGLVLGFVITLLPYAWFGFQHPGALTYRFRVISYVYDATLSVEEKGQTFITMYTRHFSPEFLIQAGDSNLRHATGYGGVIFKVIFVLGILGLLALVKERAQWQDRFRLLVVALLFASPLAAALATGDSGQTLRGLLMGLAILLIAGYGLAWIQRSRNRLPIMAVLFVILAFEATLYLQHYFTVYPVPTRVWFETYGLEPALEEAAARRPRQLTIEPNVHQIVTSVAFYKYVIPNLKTLPILFDWPRGEAGTCAISFYVESGLPAPVEVLIPGSPVKLRCY